MATAIPGPRPVTGLYCRPLLHCRPDSGPTRNVFAIKACVAIGRTVPDPGLWSLSTTSAISRPRLRATLIPFAQGSNQSRIAGAGTAAWSGGIVRAAHRAWPVAGFRGGRNSQRILSVAHRPFLHGQGALGNAPSPVPCALPRRLQQRCLFGAGSHFRCYRAIPAGRAAV